MAQWESERKIGKLKNKRGKKKSSVGSGLSAAMRGWCVFGKIIIIKEKICKVKKKRRMRGKRWDKRGEGKEVVG